MLGNLRQKLVKKTQSQLDKYNQSYQLTVDEIQFALSQGAISQSDAKELTTEAQGQLNAQKTDIVLKGFTVSFDTNMRSFESDLNKVGSSITELFSSKASTIQDEMAQVDNQIWDNMSLTERNSLSTAYNNCKKSCDQMENSYQDIVKAGEVPNKAFMDGYLKMDLARAIATHGTTSLPKASWIATINQLS